MDEKTKEFENKIKEKGYSVIGKYINNHTKILVRHDLCGHEWSVLPMQLTRSNKPTGCPKCFGTPKKNTEIFRKDVLAIGKGEYDLIGEYFNSQTKTKIKHNICGHIFEMRPNDFQQGYRCPKCFGTPKKTVSEFKKEVFNLYQNEYSVISDYTGTNSLINMMHINCGKTFKVKPNNFLNNRTKCPHCNNTKKESINVKFIEDYLSRNKIYFEREFTDKNCKNKRLLPFDFFLKDYNLLIEYDGSQHFGDRGKFKYNRNNDLIKNSFVEKSQYKLLRIPYFLFNKKKEENLETINIILDSFFREPSETIEKYKLTYIE